MKHTENREIRTQNVSLAMLGSAVALLLSAAFLNWSMSMCLWPKAGHDIQGLLLHSHLLILPILAVAILICKESSLFSKSIALMINTLAVVYSLGLLILCLTPLFMITIRLMCAVG